VHGVGGKVGPDLGEFASTKSAADLIGAVLKPHTVNDPKYTTVTLTLADGDKIVGIKKEEAGDFLRVYDTTVLPAVLRTVAKSEIVKIETSQQSIMPANYASVYSEKQLADIVAFIKSAPARTGR
jgi:putative heme-binding domain-containing protein